jgi:hypothetical protein
MTKDQLKVKLIAIDVQYSTDKNAAFIEYAMSNNPYQKGDIIKDHIGKLKIDRISTYISFGESCCVYYGVELKADGVTPMKKQSNRPVYQSNLL